MNLHLSNKVVLVTGSSRGIGFGIAKAFVEEGAFMIITGRNRNDLENAVNILGNNSSYVQADMTDINDIKNVRTQVMNQYGRLDCLVCNLGSGRSVPPGDENFAEWQRVFAINFFSATNSIETFKNDLFITAGNIICISSICGKESLGAPVTYSVAKSALNNYVNTISRHFGPKGVRINLISPGNIYFEGSVWQKKMEANREETKRLINAEVPLQQFGSLEDVANLAVFLASEKASFITGANFIIDGGQTKAI